MLTLKDIEDAKARHHQLTWDEIGPGPHSLTRGPHPGAPANS